MTRTSKSEFLRGIGAYNPAAHGPAGTPRERQRIAAKIASYDAQRGGSWSYDDLYTNFSLVLKGFPADRVRAQIAELPGPGEAKAKLAIFDGLAKTIPLGQAHFVESERQTLTFGKRQAAIAPDFSFKTNEGVFRVLVYPNNSPALKDQQRKMIVDALASSARAEPHFLILAEYPEISGRRDFEARTFECSYRTPNDDFLLHMETYYDLLNERSGLGDLFGT